MKRADMVEIYDFNEKTDIKFSKAITSHIYQHILNTCCSFNVTNEDIYKATHILWQLDPCSAVIEGEFKGVTSLMLYCVLSCQAQVKKLNINNLKKIYTDLINHPNLNVNATFTVEGPDKNKSILWFAAYNEQWELVDKLIEMEADINATCTGEGPSKGKSVLWLAAAYKQWQLVDKLIGMGANINAICTGEGPSKGKSVLWLAAAYKQLKLVDKLIELGADMYPDCAGKDLSKGKSILAMMKAYNVINKDTFYLMVISMYLRSSHFAYPPDVILTDEDKTIIKSLKEKINLYIKIFIPCTINFKNNNYYKKNNLNDLPSEIRQLIAVEYIKKELTNYKLSLSSIEYFSKEIATNLFARPSNEQFQAQSDFEEGPIFMR